MAHVVFDDNYLKKIGIDGYSEEDKNALLAKLNHAIELRVGSRIAQIVGDDKLGELTALTEAGKDAEAAQWMRDQVPNYEQIAVEELDKLTKQILENSRAILEDNI